jgi:hypothetical protein
MGSNLRTSSRPAVSVPHQKAGHMEATDRLCPSAKKALARGDHPHMDTTFFLGDTHALTALARAGDARRWTPDREPRRAAMPTRQNAFLDSGAGGLEILQNLRSML